MGKRVTRADVRQQYHRYRDDCPCEVCNSKWREEFFKNVQFVHLLAAPPARKRSKKKIVLWADRNQ